jgi:ABC-type dipeptide/oligopeptide/nickel transport system ATPase component
MMTPPLLKISDLSVDFATATGQRRVLESVSLELQPGEALALVGESGSGKSVLAHSIMHLLEESGRISQGEIWLNEEPLHLKNEKEMQQVRGKKIGMVFQDPMASLNPTLKIGWQIAEGIVFHERLTWKSAKKRALDLLERVEIADPETRFYEYPFQLSGGMRQRVMIAAALACRPLLLIADEPTTALDVTIQAQILDLLGRIRRETGMGLLLITHNLAIVSGTCNRIAVMHRGKIEDLNARSIG